MSKIVIEDVPPWDGDYEFDDSYFTNRELHRIKEISGVRAGELLDAIQSGDNDLVIALAVIAAARHGKQIPPDDLWDAKVGGVRVDFTTAADEEADAGPPEPASGDASAASAPTGRSGEASSPPSDPRANGPSPTGSPGSAITSISAPVT